MNKKGTVWILLGLILIAAAGILFFRNTREEERAKKMAEAVMEKLLAEIPALPSGSDDLSEEGEEPSAQAAFDRSFSETVTEVLPGEAPDYVRHPDMEMPVLEIDGYRYIGYISVPSTGLDMPVQSEWDYPGLRISACRYSGSVYLDNLVICGHNYFSGFGNLTGVAQGDAVIFTDVDGNAFHYSVAGVEILDPSAVKEMTESEWDLTLFTCTYSTSARVTLRCVKSDAE